MPKGAREPGEPRPAQEPPLRPGGTAPQTCKANDAGARRAQRLPRPAPHPSGTAVAPVAADRLAAPILSPPRGGAPAVWQMPRPCSFVPASPPLELDTAPQKRLPDLSLGRAGHPSLPSAPRSPLYLTPSQDVFCSTGAGLRTTGPDAPSQPAPSSSPEPQQFSEDKLQVWSQPFLWPWGHSRQKRPPKMGLVSLPAMGAHRAVTDVLGWGPCPSPQRKLDTQGLGDSKVIRRRGGEARPGHTALSRPLFP